MSKKNKDLTIQEVFDELKKGKKITWGNGYRKIKLEKGTIKIEFCDTTNLDTLIPINADFKFEE